jgi:hypothetical protein
MITCLDSSRSSDDWECIISLSLGTSGRIQIHIHRFSHDQISAAPNFGPFILGGMFKEETPSDKSAPAVPGFIVTSKVQLTING